MLAISERMHLAKQPNCSVVDELGEFCSNVPVGRQSQSSRHKQMSGDKSRYRK
jgi:hypothetical protein